MYFDIEDHRPDTPRVPTAISVREAILASLVIHLSLVIVLLLFPDMLSSSEDPEAAALLAQQQRAQQPLRFIEAVPLRDLPAPPVRPADQSDMDRQSRTRERAPVPDNSNPFMRGNTPEMVEGGPIAPPTPAPSAPAPPEVGSIPGPVEPMAENSSSRTPQGPMSQTAQQRLTDALRNPGQYVSPDRFDNTSGGETQQSADIQFDSMGVDFGPWLRRFKNQVERNWLVPAAAMSFKGHVVIRFVVLRNGVITDLVVLKPAPIPALTTAAVNALKLSNPTTSLPPDYPADRMQITVTFYYNEDPRNYR